jgi:hypothetical protein
VAANDDEKSRSFKAVPCGAAFFCVALCCDVLRLIFNGSQIMSAAPRNGKRNMLNRYPDMDDEALIDEMIERFGVDEAVRRIKARKAKGPGRPKGLAYLQTDAWLLTLTYALAIEWEKRQKHLPPNDRRYLTKPERLKKIIYVCSEHPEIAHRLRVISGLDATKNSVMKRVLTRSCLALPLMDEFHVAEMELAKGTRPAAWPLPEDWEEVHRARPDLQLLP